MRKPSQGSAADPGGAAPSDPASLALGDSGARKAGAAAAGIEPEQLAVLEAVFARRRAIGRAVSVALANVFALAATALLCLPLAFFDPWLLLGAAVLGSSAAVELRGARRMRALDPSAPRLLALNQLALLLAVAVYCGFSIHSGLAIESPTRELSSDPQLTSQLGDLAEAIGSDGGNGLIDHAYHTAVIGFYLVLLAISALYAGFCARFYLRRAEMLRAHLEQTPAWALAAQRRLLGW